MTDARRADDSAQVSARGPESPSARTRRSRLPRRAWMILALGLAIREALCFWTGQPYDLESWIRTGHAVASGYNPYSQFWPAVPGVSFAYLDTLVAPAAYLPFWSGLLGLIYQFWEVVGGGDRFVLYGLIKQPGIWADLGSAYLIYRLVERWSGDRVAALTALSFWCLFPYAIAITAVWGQFDSIVVLVLLALLYARGPLERNLLDGVGILIKWLTVIFLPFEFFRERGIRRFAIALALIVPLAITLAIFAAEGWALTQLLPTSTSQSQGGGLGMNLTYLFTLAPVHGVLGGVPYLYTVLALAWVPAVIAGGWVAARWVQGRAPGQELRALLLIVTLLLLLRWGLYEQYMLYLFAPLVVDVFVFHPGRRSLFYVTVVLAGLDLLVNNDLGLRFLSPLDPSILAFTTSVDASVGWGTARTYVLLVLAILVTVTLVQWVRAFLRDERAPHPWLLPRGESTPTAPAQEPVG